MAALLDTHVWVWWLAGTGRLSTRERMALDELAGNGELRLSAISLWEVQMAYAKGRFQPNGVNYVYRPGCAARRSFEPQRLDR